MKIVVYWKERIKHAVRFRNKRGFGVHSPFMFNLIINVLRDRQGQYDYPVAWEAAALRGRKERKCFRMISRLVRHLRVQRVVCVGDKAALLTDYLSSFCVEALPFPVPEALAGADFLYIGRRAGEEGATAACLAQALERPVRYVVVADIHRDAFASRTWRQYRDKATVCVDMMWQGLLIFDDKIQRGKYNLMI